MPDLVQNTDISSPNFGGISTLHPAPTAPDLRFGPAPGNTMSPPWAAHMLTLWFQAADKRITFADAVRATAVHFIVEGES